MNTGSVTRWINRAKAGDPDAAQKLWEAYFHRLVGLARAKLRGSTRRHADEEDLALSAFDSFFRGAEQGRFPRLADRDDLWRLLFSIVRHKAIDLRRRESRRTRDGGRQLGESALPGLPSAEENKLEQIMDKDPTPELAGEVADRLRQMLINLGDGQLQRIALWKMEGLTNAEMAARLRCVERTVERKLSLIRKLLTARLPIGHASRTPGPAGNTL